MELIALTNHANISQSFQNSLPKSYKRLVTKLGYEVSQTSKKVNDKQIKYYIFTGTEKDLEYIKEVYDQSIEEQDRERKRKQAKNNIKSRPTDVAYIKDQLIASELSYIEVPGYALVIDTDEHLRKYKIRWGKKELAYHRTISSVDNRYLVFRYNPNVSTMVVNKAVREYINEQL